MCRLCTMSLLNVRLVCVAHSSIVYRDSMIYPSARMLHLKQLSLRTISKQSSIKLEFYNFDNICERVNSLNYFNFLEFYLKINITNDPAFNVMKL